MKPKIGFVVQRYGSEITGGSELLCRQIAERLAPGYDVEVLTTTAIDHLSWKNVLPPGDSIVNDVLVRRFRVREERNLAGFHELYDRIFTTQLTSEQEIRMLRYQGPYAPDLVSYLRSERDRYDAFAVFTYMYYPAVHGLPILQSKALFVPTLHDETSLYLHILDGVFQQTPHLIFNSQEERFLAQRRFNLPNSIGRVAGIGIDEPIAGPVDPAWDSLSRRLEGKPTLTYVGRVENGKGCDELIEFFLRFVSDEKQSEPVLLLLGRGDMRIPRHRQVIAPGYVSEYVKYRALEASYIALAPSPFESLCIAALESWMHRRPLLANGKCPVLVGHCARSDGGLWYANYPEFREALNLLLRDEELRKTLGEQGRRYVEQTYRWETVMAVYEETLDEICANRVRAAALSSGSAPAS